MNKDNLFSEDLSAPEVDHLVYISKNSYEVIDDKTVIDEITNVYTMGATAFALFGEYKRTGEEWQLNEALYQIAKKAVSHDRTKRQQSISDYIKEWETARCELEKDISKAVKNG